MMLYRHALSTFALISSSARVLGVNTNDVADVHVLPSPSRDAERIHEITTSADSLRRLSKKKTTIKRHQSSKQNNALDSSLTRAELKLLKQEKRQQTNEDVETIEDTEPARGPLTSVVRTKPTASPTVTASVSVLIISCAGAPNSLMFIDDDELYVPTFVLCFFHMILYSQQHWHLPQHQL